MKRNEIIEVDGSAIDDDDMHWQANCPKCELEIEFRGCFFSSDIHKCNCGCEFKIRRIYFEDDSYIY